MVIVGTGEDVVNKSFQCNLVRSDLEHKNSIKGSCGSIASEASRNDEEFFAFAEQEGFMLPLCI